VKRNVVIYRACVLLVCALLALGMIAFDTLHGVLFGIVVTVLGLYNWPWHWKEHKPSGRFRIFIGALMGPGIVLFEVAGAQKPVDPRPVRRNNRGLFFPGRHD
jgi:hypothetical protein